MTARDKNRILENEDGSFDFKLSVKPNKAPPVFVNLKHDGNTASLSAKNPLAFNGEKAEQASRKDQQPEKNKLGTINGAIKYWRGQKILPSDAMTISAIDLELKSLNYKKRIISKDPKEARASHYFRSSIEKRLIGALIIRNTLKNLGTKQSEIRDHLGLSKGLVSKVCLDCVQEGWFEIINRASTIVLYRASQMMVESARDFAKSIFEDVKDPVILEFLRRFSIRQIELNLNAVHGMNSETEENP